MRGGGLPHGQLPCIGVLLRGWRDAERVADPTIVAVEGVRAGMGRVDMQRARLRQRLASPWVPCPP